jgi:iron(III) transport system substrate-binding protein
LRQVDAVATYAPDAAALYPASLKDPQGFFTGLYMNIYVPALNTNLVPHDQFPKSYADLLEPRFEGKMVWNPTYREVAGGIRTGR